MIGAKYHSNHFVRLYWRKLEKHDCVADKIQAIVVVQVLSGKGEVARTYRV